jgi:hypothetical protein
MKSKNYVLMQIKTLLIKNRGYYENEADEYVEKVREKTVYELLVIKKELSSRKEYPDISFMSRWFKQEDSE